MEFKDKLSIVSIVLAACAFAVSTFTTYFNIVRSTDDLSVVINGWPVAFRSSKTHFVFPESESFLSFINLGTRPAVILGTRVHFIVQKQTSKEDCQVGDVNDYHVFTTDLRPTVVRPHDLATASIKVTGEEWSVEDSFKNNPAKLEFDAQENRASDEKIPIEVCYEITFATPSLSHEVAMFSLVKYQAAVSQGGPGIDIQLDKMDLTLYRPRELIKDTQILFWNN